MARLHMSTTPRARFWRWDAGPVGRWWRQVEDLRHRHGPGSFLWSYEVNNRGGAAIALLLRATSVTPNKITICGLVVHLLGALYVAQLNGPVPVAGALV